MEKNSSVQSSPYLNRPLRSIEEAKADLKKEAARHNNLLTGQSGEAQIAPSRRKAFSRCKD